MYLSAIKHHMILVY